MLGACCYYRLIRKSALQVVLGMCAIGWALGSSDLCAQSNLISHQPPTQSEVAAHLKQGVQLSIGAAGIERARVVTWQPNELGFGKGELAEMQHEGDVFMATVPLILIDSRGSWMMRYYFQVQTTDGVVKSSESYEIASLKSSQYVALSKQIDQLEQHVQRLARVKELMAAKKSGKQVSESELTKIRLGMLDYLRTLH